MPQTTKQEIYKNYENLKIIFDHKNFIFSCLTLGTGKNPDFDFKTDKINAEKTLRNYINWQISTCLLKSSDFKKNLRFKAHYHKVEEPQKTKIEKIFKNVKKNEEWINQFIVDNQIYQTQMMNSGKARLYWIEKIKNKFLIIQPLLIDPNHMIYENKRKEKTRNYCMICQEKRCI